MKMCKEISKNLWYHGYRVQIFPTEEQKEFLDRCIDICRFIHNWALEQENKQYEEYLEGNTKYGFISFYDLESMFTKLRKELDFVESISYHSGLNVIRKVSKAYDAFFKKTARKPRFKSKKYAKPSYEIRSESMWFEDNMLKIEGLKSLIYTKYYTGLDKSFRQFKNTVISRDNMGRYFVSYNILEPKPLDHFEKNNIKPLNRAIGIDLNNKKRFVLSTGEVYYGPDISRELVNLSNKQAKVSKDINRQKKAERTNPSKEYCQSKRAKKRLNALQKQHKRIANIEENFIQTTTKKIINMRPKAIVMEDLEVKNILKEHNIAKNVYHANFYRCREVMEYKADKYGIPFIQADKEYPSTQLCSQCSNRQEMDIHKKTYKCPVCGLVIDRDINAALNLEHLAYC